VGEEDQVALEVVGHFFHPADQAVHDHLHQVHHTEVLPVVCILQVVHQVDGYQVDGHQGVVHQVFVHPLIIHPPYPGMLQRHGNSKFTGQ